MFPSLARPLQLMQTEVESFFSQEIMVYKEVSGSAKGPFIHEISAKNH